MGKYDVGMRGADTYIEAASDGAYDTFKEAKEAAIQHLKEEIARLLDTMEFMATGSVSDVSATSKKRR